MRQQRSDVLFIFDVFSDKRGGNFHYRSVNPMHVGMIFQSWILDEQTCNWTAPIPYPKDTGKNYKWDESVINWVEVV